MDFKNTKVRVNLGEESRKVQERMFKLGFMWESDKTSKHLEEARYLYFYDSMQIGWGTREDTFEQDKNKEIKVSDILEGYKPKVPTHLVIWDTENIDPHRFFTDEKEADDFVKELTEKDNVKEDSIILVEIKTAKKFKIKKQLKTEQYKI